MLPEYFAIIGAVIASLGGCYYIYETFIGTAQPNRITWLLWGIFPIIIFVAQRVQGVAGLSWTSFSAGVIPFIVLAVSFVNKKAYWQTQVRDYYLMLAAIMGIILWAITDNPNLAILFSLIADMFAGIPTLIKAYRHPQTESWVAYAIGSLGLGISILAIKNFNFETSAFAVYLFVFNIILAVLSMRGGFNKKN